MTRRTSPITDQLRALPCGQSVLIPGKKSADVDNHMRRARLGTRKWFESRTVRDGVLIARVE